MNSVWRILIVLCLALSMTQGVFAHAHVTVATEYGAPMQMTHDLDNVAGVVSETPHCNSMAASAMPCRHDHSFCCSTSCGVHCGALFAAFRVEPHADGTSLPPPLSEPQRAGVTRAPLLRPPIG
jgi:hypothetical protein